MIDGVIVSVFECYLISCAAWSFNMKAIFYISVQLEYILVKMCFLLGESDSELSKIKHIL